MKMRKVLKGLIVFLLLLMVLAAYLFFYLFPALGQINRIRRETTDIERQIKKFAKTEQGFVPFSEKEEAALLRLQGMVRDSLVQALSDNDLLALYADLVVFFQKKAKECRVENLYISPFLDQPIAEAAAKAEGVDGKTLFSKRLHLTFTASSDKAFRFILGFLIFKFRLRIDAMEVEGNKGNLNWRLYVNAYRRGKTPGWISKANYPLDVDSPILWQPLPELPSSSVGTEPEGIETCRLDAFRRAAKLNR